ncbi:cupin fold metalloprotein, WbuC family, partial [Pseudomonas otitidis]|nr:cupin fold metalloprotein, WbuC family [Pseudomonas otitidis]
VLAVGVGLLLAAGLFIKRMSELTDTQPMPGHAQRALAEGEFAPWAPREGEPGVADYLAWMRAQFP